MKTLTIYPSNINQRNIDTLANALRDGELIIFPTDTLYAIGCNALNNHAIEQICRLKNINPLKQTLSVVCADISQAADYAKIDNNAFAILKHNLPGPFTFILPASTKLPKVFKGRKTVGVRIPDNPIAHAIAQALGNPILSTSIAYQQPDEAINPDSIAMHYANAGISYMVDGGEGHTTPSAVIDLTDSSSPEIIREGPLPLE